MNGDGFGLWHFCGSGPEIKVRYIHRPVHGPMNGQADFAVLKT
jgi:hypothetical protein